MMPDTTTATLTTRSGQGTPESGVAFKFQLVEGPSGEGESYDTTPFEITSDGMGLLSVTLLRRAWYRARRGIGEWRLFQTPDAETFNLPQLNGADA